MVQWGVTARETSWEPIEYGPDLGDIPGWQGQAFKRDVAAGVKYVQPPEIDGLRTWVRRSMSGAESFVMPFAGEGPPASATVLDLQKSLAAKRSVLKDGDPDLEKLDRCIDQFLARASDLHQRQTPLGFVQPQSVVFCGDPGAENTCQLPDLGFVFDVDAWVMARPSWLSDAANVMFDATARDRNKSYLAWASAQDDQTFQPLASEDVRIAGRLIAFALVGEDEVGKWCTEGRSLGEVPPPANGLNDTACRPVWDVLHRAIRGELQSISELRELLTADARPSRHFLVKPPPPPPGALELMLRRSAWPLAAAVAALLVTWVGYQVFDRYKPRYTPVCTHESSWEKTLYPSLEDLATQVNSAAASDESKARFLKALKSYVLLLRATPGHSCDESCTERLLAKAEPWVDDEVELVVRGLREKPRHISEELVVLSEERARVEDLESLRRESSSPLFHAAMAKLDRQLALRGAKPAAQSESAQEPSQ
jgi:hypothetical protein